LISTIFRFGDINDGIIVPSRAQAKMASKEDEVTIDKTETNSDFLVPKRKTKAFVWKYFGFETDGNGGPLCVDLPKCRLCPSHTTVTAKDSNTAI